MAGYSALSQRDDKLALQLLEEHRRLLREIFPRFHGTEIKTIGDAFLVEFQSALEAAQCAIEIQRALAKRNADVPPDRRIEVKIGIHSVPRVDLACLFPALLLQLRHDCCNGCHCCIPPLLSKTARGISMIIPSGPPHCNAKSRIHS